MELIFHINIYIYIWDCYHCLLIIASKASQHRPPSQGPGVSSSTEVITLTFKIESATWTTPHWIDNQIDRLVDTLRWTESYELRVAIIYSSSSMEFNMRVSATTQYRSGVEGTLHPDDGYGMFP